MVALSGLAIEKEDCLLGAMPKLLNYRPFGAFSISFLEIVRASSSKMNSKPELFKTSRLKFTV
jgi:hypothetical protein